MTPSTGEVWMADLDPVRGSEQGRRRPVVIFQNPALAQFTSTFLAVPMTTNMRRKGLIGTCLVLKGDGGVTEDSILLAFHARSLDRTRLVRRMGTLKQESIEGVADAILSAFGIDVTP